MNRIKQTYDNFKKNDLAKCKKIGNWVGWFVVVTQILYLISINQNLSFVPFFVGAVLHCLVGYFMFRWLTIAASSSIFYFVELVSPRKEKSYLPNEAKEE